MKRLNLIVSVLLTLSLFPACAVMKPGVVSQDNNLKYVEVNTANGLQQWINMNPQTPFLELENCRTFSHQVSLVDQYGDNVGYVLFRNDNGRVTYIEIPYPFIQSAVYRDHEIAVAAEEIPESEGGHKFRLYDLASGKELTKGDVSAIGKPWFLRYNDQSPLYVVAQKLHIGDDIWEFYDMKGKEIGSFHKQWSLVGPSFIVERPVWEEGTRSSRLALDLVSGKVEVLQLK